MILKFVNVHKRVIVIFLLISSYLFGNELELKGTIVKILNDGRRQIFSNQTICIKYKENKMCQRTYKRSEFSFKIKTLNQNLYGGEEIQLSIQDKYNEWFMLSPFKGKYLVPSQTKDIEILMIPKKSTIYLTLFSKINYHTIQVFSFLNEKSAIDMTNKLKRDCINIIRKGTEYCTQYINYTSYLRNNRPNNGYIYKVNFGKYKKKSYAEKDKNFINKKYSAHGIIKTYIKIVEK